MRERRARLDIAHAIRAAAGRLAAEMRRDAPRWEEVRGDARSSAETRREAMLSRPYLRSPRLTNLRLARPIEALRSSPKLGDGRTRAGVRELPHASGPARRTRSARDRTWHPGRGAGLHVSADEIAARPISADEIASVSAVEYGWWWLAGAYALFLGLLLVRKRCLDRRRPRGERRL